MIESIAPFLSLIASAAKAMNWFADLRKKTKGDVRALIEEIKENSRLCFRVVEDGVSPAEVMLRFSTAVFDRLNENGFDFNAVKRKDIRSLQLAADSTTRRLGPRIINIHKRILLLLRHAKN